MKVFLATLLIAGCAASVPCTNLKAQQDAALLQNVQDIHSRLLQDVQDIKANAQQVIQRSSAHAEEDVAALIKDPSAGSATLMKNLISVGRYSVSTTIAGINKITKNIMAAAGEVEIYESGEPLLPILDNLRQQLFQTAREANFRVFQLLEEGRSLVDGNVKALLADLPGAAKAIQECWKAHHNRFLSAAEKYVITVQQQVQDAFDKINQQLKQQGVSFCHIDCKSN